MLSDRARTRRRKSRSFGTGHLFSAAPIAFAILAVTIALTGGSSRQDNSWLLILRPISVLCIVTMLLAGIPKWRELRPLPLLLMLFAATIAIQLIPVPPSIWYGLGGRESYDAVALALDGAGSWRMLAIAPDKAWNSLLALMTPLGMLIGFGILDERQRQSLLLPLLGLVTISMLLGVAQVVGGGYSPLYWYKVSGHGQLIGLLANRNHQGALLALALPLIRAWTLQSSGDRRVQQRRTYIGLAGAAVAVLYVLILGSRAGIALTLVGLVTAFLIQPSLGSERLSKRTARLVAGGVIAGIAILLGLATMADRAVSLSRLTMDDLSTEGRLAAMPTLFQIIKQTFPWGTGYGSFVPVYASYEPDALLKPTYFNNAHNDLIELIITGGLPALAVFGAFLVWFLKTSWKRIFHPCASRSRRALQRASSAAILILLLASITDYPLRTPLLGAIFTLLCCWLAWNFEQEPVDANP